MVSHYISYHEAFSIPSFFYLIQWPIQKQVHYTKAMVGMLDEMLDSDMVGNYVCVITGTTQ